MIDMILATDMAKHFTDIANFKNRCSAEDFAPEDGDKTLCLQIMIHLADLNNPTKPWKSTLRWTGLLYVEFFDQGDLEREQERPISMLMDRKTVNIAKSQVGFMGFIIQPAFETYMNFLPNVQKNLDQMAENKPVWEGLVETFQKRLEAGEFQIPEALEIVEMQNQFYSAKISNTQHSSVTP